MVDHNDRYFMPAMTPSSKGCAASEGWPLENHIIGWGEWSGVERGEEIVGVKMYKAELRAQRLEEKGLACYTIQGSTTGVRKS